MLCWRMSWCAWRSVCSWPTECGPDVMYLSMCGMALDMGNHLSPGTQAKAWPERRALLEGHCVSWSERASFLR